MPQLTNKVPMFLYDEQHGMTPDKYRMFKRFSGEQNPKFTKEIWTCSEHGDFPVIGIVGQGAPTVTCPYCRDAELLKEETKDIWLDLTFPYSGLYPTQRNLTLESFGEEAASFYSFMKNPNKFFFLCHNATDTEEKMATALVVDYCRTGKQGHYITYQNLKYRVQASWKGKTNTEQLTKDMAKFPLLVIGEIDSGVDSWMEIFLKGLFSARSALKRKTVLLGDFNLRNAFGSKVMSKVTIDITQETRR